MNGSTIGGMDTKLIAVALGSVAASALVSALIVRSANGTVAAQIDSINSTRAVEAGRLYKLEQRAESRPVARWWCEGVCTREKRPGAQLQRVAYCSHVYDNGKITVACFNDLDGCMAMQRTDCVGVE